MGNEIAFDEVKKSTSRFGAVSATPRVRIHHAQRTRRSRRRESMVNAPRAVWRGPAGRQTADRSRSAHPSVHHELPRSTTRDSPNPTFLDRRRARPRLDPAHTIRRRCRDARPRRSLVRWHRSRTRVADRRASAPGRRSDADIRAPKNVQSLRVRLHQPVLDGIVDHVDEVPRSCRRRNGDTHASHRRTLVTRLSKSGLSGVSEAPSPPTVKQ